MNKFSRIFMAVVTMLAVFTLAACSSADNHASVERANFAVAPSAPMPASAPAMGGTSSVQVQMEQADFYFRSADDFSASTPSGGTARERAPMRIKTGSMRMESEDVHHAASLFEFYTHEFGGWVESRNISTSRDSFANLTLRVPAAYYEDFILVVSEIGRVRDFNDSVIDASAEYFDAQARLEINLAEKERLLEFIERADNLEDIILLEARLSDVRTNIELHEGNMRRIERDVSYSTLHVSIHERNAPTIQPIAANLGTRMGDGFTDSLSSVLNTLANIAVFFAYVSVPLALFGACAFVGIKVNKRLRKGRA